MATQEWDLGEASGTEVLHLDAGAALTAADRAQIDVQISTAKRYPRDIARSQREALALVTADEEVAGSMFYALPRKQDGKSIHIEGPSVRFAETLVYCWGNIRAEARIVGTDDTHITAQGTCIDLEKNIGARVEVRRRITDKKGRRFSEDMIITTGNAASSIAYRNAVFKVVPMALAKRIYEAAKRTATGGVAPIEARRQRALAWFARVGAPEERVLALLEIGTVNEITEEHLITLTGLKNAISDGDTTIEEAFGGGARETGPSAQTADLNERVRRANAAREEAPPASELDAIGLTGDAPAASPADPRAAFAAAVWGDPAGPGKPAEADRQKILLAARELTDDDQERAEWFARHEGLGKAQAAEVALLAQAVLGAPTGGAGGDTLFSEG